MKWLNMTFSLVNHQKVIVKRTRKNMKKRKREAKCIY